jgi:hypothetical protein
MKLPHQALAVRRGIDRRFLSATGLIPSATDPPCDPRPGSNKITCGLHCCDSDAEYCIQGECKDKQIIQDSMPNGLDEFCLANHFCWKR